MEQIENSTKSAVARLLGAVTPSLVGNTGISLAGLRYWAGRPAVNDGQYAAPSTSGPISGRIGAKKGAKRARNVLFFPIGAKTPKPLQIPAIPRHHWLRPEFPLMVSGDNSLTPSQPSVRKITHQTAICGAKQNGPHSCRPHGYWC